MIIRNNILLIHQCNFYLIKKMQFLFALNNAIVYIFNIMRLITILFEKKCSPIIYLERSVSMKQLNINLTNDSINETNIFAPFIIYTL